MRAKRGRARVQGTAQERSVSWDQLLRFQESCIAPIGMVPEVEVDAGIDQESESFSPFELDADLLGRLAPFDSLLPERAVAVEQLKLAIALSHGGGVDTDSSHKQV